MSQPQLSSRLIVIECVDSKPTKESLLQLFFDLDFTENEEFFRKDTIKKGFNTEAERIVTELLKKKNLEAIDMIEICLNKQFESSGFYVDHSFDTHTVDYTGSGDLERIIVSVAYMTEC